MRKENREGKEGEKEKRKKAIMQGIDKFRRRICR